MTFSNGEIAGLVAAADPDHDGAVTNAELAKATGALDESVIQHIIITANGARCAGKLDSATLAEQDGVTLNASYNCHGVVKSFDVDLAVLPDLSHGHRHIAHAETVTGNIDPVLFAGHTSFHVDVAKPAADAPAAAKPKSQVFAFFRLGIEHILTGYDHLVFLLALVLLGGKVRSLLKTITAFTLAHSVSLALAVLGVWAPSPRIVEPAIALSIAYVGVENFFVKDPDKRWRITLPFGFIHGFGFAGALQEIAMPKAQIPVALGLFNMGVESGQLLVLGVVLPLVLIARRKDWFKNVGVKLVSAAILAAGVVWFVLRVSDVG
jgi:hydrogenase/urease accessory protein HupE